MEADPSTGSAPHILGVTKSVETSGVFDVALDFGAGVFRLLADKVDKRIVRPRGCLKQLAKYETGGLEYGHNSNPHRILTVFPLAKASRSCSRITSKDGNPSDTSYSSSNLSSSYRID